MHLFIEHITVIDSAYLCHERGLVGESWIVDVALIGELNDSSMVMDFGRAKPAIKHAIDEWVDHRLLVPTRSVHVDNVGQQSVVSFTFGNQHLTHRSPHQALCLIDTESITSDALTTYLNQRLMEVLPETVKRVEITLRHESPDAPYYHYVHGLKKHDGNCQRIAHGHRSRLRISRNGAYDETLTRHWAGILNDRYIGSRVDIAGTDTIHTHFAYDAPQGRFELSYPTARCHIIETDSTVECIAQHIADCCKQHAPHDQFHVRAYEGVMKGAIGEA
jgi:6-pyruvoyl-tetrahydropterin synthase